MCSVVSGQGEMQARGGFGLSLNRQALTNLSTLFAFGMACSTSPARCSFDQTPPHFTQPRSCSDYTHHTHSVLVSHSPFIYSFTFYPCAIRIPFRSSAASACHRSGRLEAYVSNKHLLWRKAIRMPSGRRPNSVVPALPAWTDEYPNLTSLRQLNLYLVFTARPSPTLKAPNLSSRMLEYQHYTAGLLSGHSCDQKCRP